MYEIYRFITFLGIKKLLYIKHYQLIFMSDSACLSPKGGAKLLSNLVIISIFSSDNPLDFHKSIQVVPLKYLMYFLAGINTKQFWDIPEGEYVDPLRIPNLLVKYFVIPFFNISFIFILIVHLIHFYLNFLVYHQNLSFLRSFSC